MTYAIHRGALVAAVLAWGAAGAQAETPPAPEGWSVTLAFGAIAAPKYLGDDDYELSLRPGFRVAYGDRFFASVEEGIGYNAINTDTWRVGPILRYDFGRDQDGDNPFRVSGGGTNDLAGLGDVDGTVELGGFAERDFGDFTARLELRQGLGGGHEGLVGEAGVTYRTILRGLGAPVFLSVGPNLQFASSDYVSAFFDVNAAQSAASGLAVYDAGGGITSYGIGSALIYPLGDRVAIVGFADYDILAGDVADSSLVRQRGSRHQGRFGLFTTYRF